MQSMAQTVRRPRLLLLHQLPQSLLLQLHRTLLLPGVADLLLSVLLLRQVLLLVGLLPGQLLFQLLQLLRQMLLLGPVGLQLPGITALAQAVLLLLQGLLLLYQPLPTALQLLQLPGTGLLGLLQPRQLMALLLQVLTLGLQLLSLLLVLLRGRLVSRLGLLLGFSGGNLLIEQ